MHRCGEPARGTEAPDLKARGAEVHQEPDVERARFQVIDHLGLLTPGKLRERLDLDQHVAMAKEVAPVGAVQRRPVIDDRNAHLLFEGDVAFGKLLGQSAVVDPLKETASQDRVDTLRGPDDGVCPWIEPVHR